ncbi:hypothetical protein AVEN_94214-1 [Araneus ventricosus]|uniref:Uncharacterized protein n=1 Tax=Araneus ventricosus TaxID=182803 RepID=A0A4Y2B5L8_ARAVE|nr:hypothetical protein AVEN_94214-1 [Araneus ventricosus]
MTALKPCSHGVWLGKPLVSRVSYLLAAVDGIIDGIIVIESMESTNRAVSAARGLTNLESLKVRTCGLWSMEFRPVAPFVRRVAWKISRQRSSEWMH